MDSRSSAPLLALVVAAVALCAAAGDPKNPCHNGRFPGYMGASCSLVVLPKGMGTACRLRAVRPNGDLKNCKDIYRESKGCIKKLERYVELNPCDGRRKEMLARFKMGDARAAEDLDYFLYAINEECCDCITQGAEETDIGSIDLNRKNCQSHAYWDICAVLPAIKAVIKEGREKPDLTNVPKMCTVVATSRENQFNTLPRSMAKFLRRFMQAAQCRNRSVWTPCYNMESAQSRV